MYDREAFYHALLDALDAPKNDNNLHALRAWGECEGSAAQYNPLDTTQHEEGATEYNTFGDHGEMHVWNYPNEATGVRATVITLHNGYYPHLLAAIKDGSGKIVSGDARSEMRVWGTNPDCIARKLEGALTDGGTDNGQPAARSATPTPFEGAVRDQVQRVFRHLSTRHHPLTEADHNLLKRLVKQAQRVVKL